MNFKKLLSLMLIFCLVFSFAACGGRDVDDDDDDRTSSSSRIKDDDDDDDRDTGKDKDRDKKDDDGKDKGKKDDDDARDKDVDDDKGTGTDVGVFATYPVGKIPDGYPIDKYPNYKGAHVWMGIKEDKGGYYGYALAVVYDEEFDTIDQFYVDYLKEADDFTDTKTPMGNAYQGTLNGYKFEIFTGETSEGLTQATIALTEIPSSGNVLKSLDRAELPAGYPINDFPIIDGGALYDASESESNGEISYTLYIFTDKSIKEIVKFYDENIINYKDRNKYSDSDSFNISGTANGYYFYIDGYKETEDNVELIKYSISLDPESE